MAQRPFAGFFFCKARSTTLKTRMPQISTVATNPTSPALKIGVIAFGAVLLLSFYQLTIENSYAPLRPEIAVDLHINTLQTALISSSFLIAYALVQIPAGFLIDRIGTARILPFVAIATGLGAYFMSKSDGMNGAVAGRALMGIAAAFGCPAAASIARRALPLMYFPLCMGLTDMAIGLGGVSGTWGGNELQAMTHWRTALQIAAVAALPLSLILFFAIRNRWFGSDYKSTVDFQPKLSVVGTIKDLWARKNVRIASLIFAGGCGTICGFGGMWNMQLAESWAWKEPQAILIGSSFYVGIAIGSPLTGSLGVRFGSRATILTCMSITLPAFLFWLLVPIDWPIWFDAFNVAVIGAGLSSVTLAFEIAGRSLPSGRVATAIAMVNLAGICAGAILEIIPGIVTHFLNASPLREMQIANAVFAVMLAVTIWATTLVRKAE